MVSKEEEFLALAKSLPMDDLRRLPLPDNLREKLGVFQDISYYPLQKALHHCLFNDNRYDEMVVITNDPTKEFPDLRGLADEYKKQFLVEADTDTTLQIDNEPRADTAETTILHS